MPLLLFLYKSAESDLHILRHWYVNETLLIRWCVYICMNLTWSVIKSIYCANIPSRHHVWPLLYDTFISKDSFVKEISLTFSIFGDCSHGRNLCTSSMRSTATRSLEIYMNIWKETYRNTLIILFHEITKITTNVYTLWPFYVPLLYHFFPSFCFIVSLL